MPGYPPAILILREQAPGSPSNTTSGLRSVAPVAVGSVSGALEPLLTRHARGHVGNGTEPRRRDRCPALRADAVFAIGDAAQRDLQALRPLTEAGRAEARQLLLFEALGEVEEVATRQTGARHPGLGLQSLADRGELGLQQELRTTLRVSMPFRRRRRHFGSRARLWSGGRTERNPSPHVDVSNTRVRCATGGRRQRWSRR